MTGPSRYRMRNVDYTSRKRITQMRKKLQAKSAAISTRTNTNEKDKVLGGAEPFLYTRQNAEPTLGRLALGNGKCQPGSRDKVVSDISARSIYDIFDRYCL